MALYKQPHTAQSGARVSEFDAGLRAYMLKIYNYMASALVLTGLVAYFASTSSAFMGLMVTPQGGLSVTAYVLMFAPLGVVFYLSARIHAMSEGAAQAWFWGYAALMGLSLWSVFVVFTGESIVRTFFITAVSFGGLSLYGYVTKRDLSGFGSFLVMGVIGLLVASVVNIFLQSSAMQFIISVLGVLIFAGLTAYDTQRLKVSYYQLSQYGASLGKAAIMGALQLYLDFINMFMFLLQFFGDRR
ncbi:MAG: Bax inhibitor-1/YccA family protein [Rickettsiales bacterium]|nr:Bax inhibitor-1/YccA family protein [Rickettsiales bacterium]